MRDDLGKFEQLAQVLRTASAAHDDAAAEKIVFVDMEPMRRSIDDGLGKLIDFNTNGAHVSYETSKASYRSTMVVTVSLLVVAAGIVGASIWFAVAGIAAPVRKITQAMNRLASGDAATPVPFSGRADEVGEMAAAVEVFRVNAQNNARLESEAAAQRSLSQEKQRAAAEQERARADAMAQATTGLADGLRHLSSGDLTFELEQAFAPDFENLRADFNRAVAQLRGTLTNVSQAGSSIDAGAREVSRSADDLSKRTEQQAASLEETAAALDQITANVSNSSKRAEEARAVAIQASGSADHSGKIVAEAVDAMRRIEDSSSKVTNIIAVIDEIAFQTNLLALNAGVEAARAGEAGKGFAVVAQEVRELAQRSATAAKEIKDLIRNSTVEVETGVRLVSETGEALSTISEFIVSINQHMDAIATSSREQSVGLSEVNTAVNQMDQVTQQNAAMVEEANAAGATLATEANRLRELIGEFQLGTSSASSSTMRYGAKPSLVSQHVPRSIAASSPARGMINRLTSAFSGRGGALPAASEDNWEEF